MINLARHVKSIVVYLAIKETWRRVNTTTRVENHFNQDSAAEIKAIQNLMRKAYLEISLIREQSHKEVTQNFDQNPGPKLIQMIDKKHNKSEDLRLTKLLATS